MNPCRCGHSLFRHYDQDAGANCTQCLCPEYRAQEIPDNAAALAVDGDDDWQLRNMAG